MKLSWQKAALPDLAADWLIVPLWEDDLASGGVAQLDERLGRVIAGLRETGDLGGKPNELVPLLNPQGIKAERLLLVGLGKKGQADRCRLIDAAAAAARHVSGKPRRRVAFALPDSAPGLGGDEVAQAIGVGLFQGSFGPGIRKNEQARFAPDEVVLIASSATPDDAVQRGANRAAVLGKYVALAKELVNLPPGEKYPEVLAERARQVASGNGIDCTILDEKQLERERMGSLLGVAMGSERPPRLVVLRYQGNGDAPWLGYVGKGVTFDSGGLSLKTNEQMLDMKCDMAGAAAVLGGLAAIAELKLPVNVLGIMALVENLPSGKALKLGDVLKARNGKTIEVLNTDAEGRLILADALSYAVDLKAERIVDLATLTGAVMVALGEEVAGLLSNNNPWAAKVAQAAQRAGERVWPLPMFPLYNDMIKSNVADIKNVAGKRYAGAIVGAKFLEHFVGDVPWVHLDIAGPAWAEGENAVRDAGGTGFGVRTLVELAQG